MTSISILSVAKNNRAGIEKTYRSIISQDIDLHEIEWIVKDAGSTDQTRELLQQIENDRRLPNFIWDSSADLGLYDGMNIAMDMATGLYALFLNSGDYLYENDILSRTAAVIRDHGNALPTFLLGDDIVHNINGQFIYRKARDIGYLWHSLPCSHQAIFYNMAHAGDIRYNLKYRICGDYQFTLEIYKKRYKSHKHLRYVVSVFEAGGHAVQQRLKLSKEAYIIKKEVAGTPFLTRSFSFLAGYFNGILMTYFTRFYNVYRKQMDQVVSTPQEK